VSRLQGVVERLVARLKGDPAYRLATKYTDRQLATVLWFRGRQVLRGVPLRLTVRGVRGVVFRGRRVVVEHANQLTAGPGLILEDNAFIHALSIDGVNLGRNVTIARGATLTCTGVLAELGVGIRVGDRSAVGAGSFLGGQGGIEIGNDVIIGPGARIFSENHRYDSIDRSIRDQGQVRAATVIANDCWIGAGTTILAGVKIGTGTVVAAGAVVTKNIPPLSLAAGVPARVLRSRRPVEAPESSPISAEALRPAALQGRDSSTLRADR
jgi:carbonic anhydrase/acetyltransferase-like protein (isoleucine patch superfamily)